MVDMVIIDGVRFRPEDVPDKSEDTETEAEDTTENESKAAKPTVRNKARRTAK